MNDFELTLLGTSSSQPAFGRFPTSQILRYHNDLYMIDCGEGTQIQLSQFKIKRNLIGVIFISHLHGDHIFGLPGVITSFLHYSRTTPLHIIGPIGIKKYVDTCIELSGSQLNYVLNVTEFDANIAQTLYEDRYLSVRSLPLKHRLPTMGFIFEEQPQPRKLRPEKIEMFGLSHQEIKTLKADQTVVREDGITLHPDEFNYPKSRPRRYAFLSDTIYDPSLVEAIREVNVVYHETTYLNDMEKEALMRMHATSLQAANIAAAAHAGMLITGHYSSRYKDISAFETECRTIFENTQLGLEGRVYPIL
ncbi:MAG: ribonuclease Z [Saprospiraceae bacterium]|nr:ribonuclease Z [Saprospiraceae bacterium]